MATFVLLVGLTASGCSSYGASGNTLEGAGGGHQAQLNAGDGEGAAAAGPSKIEPSRVNGASFDAPTAPGGTALAPFVEPSVHEDSTAGVESSAAATPPATFATPSKSTGDQTPSPVTPHVFGGTDRRVFVLGDSVLLAAENMIPTVMPGWDVTVDAKVSRTIDQGITVLEQGEEDLGAVVVVHLCTNYGKGGGFAKKLARVMELLADVERVVLVTCVNWSDGQPEANAIIEAAPRSYPKVVVADWAPIARSAGNAGADGIHLLPPGVMAISRLIAGAVGPASLFTTPTVPARTTPTSPTSPTSPTPPAPRPPAAPTPPEPTPPEPPTAPTEPTAPT